VGLFYTGVGMTQPDNRGGYRPPTKPAPVSGPGKLSRRTDGRQAIQTLPDAAYGEQATFRADQQGAPMAEAQSMGGPVVSPLDMSRVVPFGAPTQYPDEPVTAGADAGLGPSSAAIRGPADQSFQELVAILPTLEIVASSPGASPEFRAFVRMVRGSS